ncbi:MAG: hypothetical protein F4029_11905 [Gammaproteobacteria bacterium]|nr:hypothetical protein [Gammaproteobacteria bacterium]MYF29596.1 hypothetical protein [Gammaproteobacteria bacterium]MYK46917.1 hypothetical protein [Gammaproteobacteria bacterium]
MPHRGVGFETIIASPYDYEELVAEMYFDGKFIGQIIKEKGDDQMEIEFGDPEALPEAICRKADLDGFLVCVQTARDRLAGRMQ